MISSLSAPATLSSSLNPNPAEAISRRYQLELSPVWCDWFQCAAQLESEHGEFSQPVDPDVLVAARPELIWPGFMLPDTLPVLGNGYGDWICMRVTPDNRAGEVLHWYHGGGDWMPWGKHPGEAIAFDRLRPHLTGRRVGHSLRPYEPSEPQQRDHLAAWAAEQLPSPFGNWLKDPQSMSIDAWSMWIEHDVASVAMRGEQALLALDGRLRQRFRADIARKLGVAWEPDVVRWMFDERLVDSTMRQALLDALQMNHDELECQDWNAANQFCRRVTDQRADLGWCWDLMGWVAEQQSHFHEAARCYWAGMQTSSFSDQSIRFRTHWFPERFGKFAAYRLHAILPHLAPEFQHHELLQLYWHDSSQGLRHRVYGYWMEQADRCAATSDHHGEYEALYHAGWDLGCDDLSAYSGILMRMSNAAHHSGQEARAIVAATHAACLNR